MLSRLGVDGLGFRTVAVFLAGALVLQAVLLLVVVWPGGPGRPVFLLPAPEHAAAMATALERAPPALQPAIVEALDSDTAQVRLAPDYPREPDPGAVREAPRLERLFGRYAAALGGRPFRVQTLGGAGVSAGFGGEIVGARPVRLVIRLRTGQVLVIERSAPTAVRRFRARAAIVGAASLLVLLVVFLASWRQTAQPVRALAKAARTLPHDLRGPDLPVQGAREVKDLSRAFNEMKRTIGELIEQRTRVLAAIAHDLRTYLTRLRMRAEFIADPEQRDRAVADLDEMSLLLEDTLTFAREAAVAPAEQLPEIEVAAAIRAFAATRIEMGQAVSVAPVDHGLVARCAPLALRRMLDNLVDNALRYGGAARLGAAAQRGGIQVWVEDDGPGVPKEALGRLTAPFERLEPSRGRLTGGAGLGLAIVQALAESQGGRLSLANRSEGGLRATLCLRPSRPPPRLES